MNSKLNSLPLLAMKEVPEPNASAQSISGLVKQSGRVSGYLLSNGRQVDKATGVQLARQGEIRGVGIAERNGSEYLKSLPDSSEANNLGNLPSVSKD